MDDYDNMQLQSILAGTFIHETLSIDIGSAGYVKVLTGLAQCMTYVLPDMISSKLPFSRRSACNHSAQVRAVHVQHTDCSSTP